jgi:hypothetical protein
MGTDDLYGLILLRPTINSFKQPIDSSEGGGLGLVLGLGGVSEKILPAVLCGWLCLIATLI